MTTIEEYAREVVDNHPAPPRRASLKALVLRSYASRPGRIVLAVGLILGVPAIVFALFAGGTLIERATLLILVWSITLVVLASPAIRGLRAWNAVVHGEVVIGEIIRAQWLGPSRRGATIDAQDHGMTRGTWRIQHSDGAFESSFESDSPWAEELRPGTSVRVLVHPQRKQVLISLGPITT